MPRALDVTSGFVPRPEGSSPFWQLVPASRDEKKYILYDSKGLHTIWIDMLEYGTIRNRLEQLINYTIYWAY